MTVFRDITYCPFSRGCSKSASCFRAITQEIEEIMKKEPVSQFAERPDCFKETDGGKNGYRKRK